MARVLPIAVAVAALALAAGCGGGGAAGTTTTAPATTAKAAAPVEQQRPFGVCLPTSPALDRAILKDVVLDGARFVKTGAVRSKQTPTYYYVSASVDGSGTRDMLATWVTSDLTGGRPIYAVDSNAALISQFGSSQLESESLGVGATASLHSRRCVAGAHAGPGIPAPLGGGGAPAGQ